eukprot:4776510-Prymnesium_polylepis.3
MRELWPRCPQSLHDLDDCCVVLDLMRDCCVVLDLMRDCCVVLDLVRGCLVWVRSASSSSTGARTRSSTRARPSRTSSTSSWPTRASRRAAGCRPHRLWVLIQPCARTPCLGDTNPRARSDRHHMLRVRWAPTRPDWSRHRMRWAPTLAGAAALQHGAQGLPVGRARARRLDPAAAD